VDERLLITPYLLLKLIFESSAHISAIVTYVTLIIQFQVVQTLTIEKSVC